MEALHIAVAKMVNTKAINSNDSTFVHWSTPLHLAENVNEVEGRRAKDCDKKCREQETRKREQKFDRSFLRFLFGSLAAFRSQ